LVLSHNYLITPNLLNEFRFGLSLWALGDHFPLEGATVANTLGLQGLDFANTPPGTGGFSGFNFNDGTGFTAIGHGRDGPTGSTNYQFGDNLSWTKGRHTMKYGVDIRHLGDSNVVHTGNGDDFGNLTFNSNAFSGNAFVDMLLGLPSLSEHSVIGPNLNLHVNHYDVYARDEWRVNDRLTISYGLRYELHPSMTEAHGNITNFNPAYGDVIIPDHAIQDIRARRF
jgi:outer membrane receptor protein involved in Fe transport